MGNTCGTNRTQRTQPPQPYYRPSQLRLYPQEVIRPNVKTIPSHMPLAVPDRIKTLHVFMAHFNPAGFARPKHLFNDTIKRLSEYQRSLELKRSAVRIMIHPIELIYHTFSTGSLKGPESIVSPQDSIDHQIYVTDPVNVFWSKENLINLGIKKYLSKDPKMKYIAWIDGDIIFESPTWVEDTIRSLDIMGINGGHVQMFSTATLEGPVGKEPLMTVKSFGWRHSSSHIYEDVENSHPNYWHPGFAWACTLGAFQATGGLIQSTLGSADRHMAMALINKASDSCPKGISQDYRSLVENWALLATKAGLKLGYTPGHIRHQWHGPLSSRQYVGCWDILVKYGFQPSLDLYTRSDGLLVWSHVAPKGMLEMIRQYFKQREEDSTVYEAPSEPFRPITTINRSTFNISTTSINRPPPVTSDTPIPITKKLSAPKFIVDKSSHFKPFKPFEISRDEKTKRPILTLDASLYTNDYNYDTQVNDHLKPNNHHQPNIHRPPNDHCHENDHHNRHHHNGYSGGNHHSGTDHYVSHHYDNPHHDFGYSYA